MASAFIENEEKKKLVVRAFGATCGGEGGGRLIPLPPGIWTTITSINTGPAPFDSSRRVPQTRVFATIEEYCG